MSGIALFQSGNPLTVGAGVDNLGYGGGTNNRADQVSPVTYPKTRFEWFSKASFAKPAALQWGTAARNSIVGPGRNNWNLSLYKQVAVTENVGFQFRVEAYNAFNHTQWTNPNTNRNDGNFGTISGTQNPRTIQLGAKLTF